MVTTVLGLDNKVSKSGDTMTGTLVVPSLTVTAQLNANATFEAGLAPWTTGSGGALSQSPTQPYKGTYSAKLVPDGVSSQAFAQSELIPCAASAQITAQAWLYCPLAVGGAQSVSLSVNWFDSGQNYLSTSTNSMSLAAAIYTPVYNTYTSPANASFCQLVPVIGGTPSASQILYFDEIRIASASSQMLAAVIAQSLQIPATGHTGHALIADQYGNASWQPIVSSSLAVPASLSGALATQSVLTIVNSTGAPTMPLVQINAKNSGDQVLGVVVGGDSVQRLVVDSTGKLMWSTGALATDTNLYRASAGIVRTDNSLQASQNVGAAKNIRVGGLTDLGDGGVGELQLTNVTTVPTTNPTGGGVLYAHQAVPVWRDTGGNSLGMVRIYEASASGDTTLVANSTSEVDVTGATVSVVVTGSAATVNIEGLFDVAVTAFGTAVILDCILSWGGTDQGSNAPFNITANSLRQPVSQNWVITGVTAGTYVAKLRARFAAAVATTSAAVKGTNSNIVVTVVEG